MCTPHAPFLFAGTAGSLDQGPDQGLHLALWGFVDPDTDQVHMTVGLPAATLRKAGATHLPDSYHLPLSLHGSIDAPRLDLRNLSQRIAQLLVVQAARGAAAAAGAAATAAAGAGPQQSASRVPVPPTPPTPGPGVAPAAGGAGQSGLGEGEAGGGASEQGEAQPEGGVVGAEAAEATESQRKKEKRGFGQRLLGLVATVAAPLVAPSWQELEQRLQGDAAHVPVQECAVPWLQQSEAVPQAAGSNGGDDSGGTGAS